MEIVIKGEAKEIADLVREIQDQQFDSNMELFVRMPYTNKYVPAVDFFKVPKSKETEQL